MNMSNKTYDILKWIAMYLLPAAGTLYFALAGIWSLPYGEQVVGTITAVDTDVYKRQILAIVSDLIWRDRRNQVSSSSL